MKLLVVDRWALHPSKPGVTDVIDSVYEQYFPDRVVWEHNPLCAMAALDAYDMEGWVLTTVERRELWGWLPPKVKTVVLNGREGPSYPTEVAALLQAGVPIATAKNIEASNRFWGNSGKGKYAGHVEEAKERLYAAYAGASQRYIDWVQGWLDHRSYQMVDDLPDDVANYDGPAALDLETTSLSPFEGEIVGVSVSIEPYVAYYVPIQSNQFPPNLSKLIRYGRLVMHNAKFDVQWLRHQGFITGCEHDTMVMAYVLGYENRSLKDLCKKLFRESTVSFEDVVKKGEDFSSVDILDATKYACQDADLTLRLYERLAGEMQEHHVNAYQKLDRPLISTIADMELAGAPLSLDEVRELYNSTRNQQDALLDYLRAEAWEDFNPKSTPHVRKLLFEERKLRGIKETKTGWSTDKFTMKVLAEEDPIAGLILQWRERDTLCKTFLKPMLDKYGVEGSVRIHGSFNQCVTATGRLSASNPNLQNIPPVARACYVAEDERVFLALDYEQQELRIMAYLSEDPVLLGAFERGEDVHEQTNQLLNIGNRKVAKTFNFAVSYGAGEGRLAQAAGIRRSEARRILRKHKDTYRRLWEWVEEQHIMALENGYVETLSGRRLALKGVHDPRPDIVAGALRQAQNYPIQGSAGDVTKQAMNDIYYGKQMTPIIQVHDEVVFEVWEEAVEGLAAMLKEEMEAAPARLGHPDLVLPVSVAWGKKWSEAH